MTARFVYHLLYYLLTFLVIHLVLDILYTNQMERMKDKHFILRVNAEEPKAYKCQDWQEQEGDWGGWLAPGAEDWLVSNAVSIKPNWIHPESLIVLCGRKLCVYVRVCCTIIHTVHTSSNTLWNNYVATKRKTNKDGRMGESSFQAFFLFWCFLKQTASVSCQAQNQSKIILDAIFGLNV